MHFFRLSICLASGGLMLALILGWFQAFHPAFDSFSTFRFFFSVPLLCLLPILWMMSEKAFGLIGALTLVISVALTMPHLPGVKRGHAVVGSELLKDQPRLRAAQANILFRLDDATRTAKTLLDAKPDVIFLQEVASSNESLLQTLAADFPYQLNCRINGRFHSVAILSRLPFIDGSLQTCPRPGGLAIAQVRWNNIPINLASYHGWWPWPKNQTRQINGLTPDLENLSGPTIIGGDFNAAPWSHAVSRVAEVSNTIVPSGAWHSWKPGASSNSWPNIAVLPIDHFLHSKHFGFSSRTLLPDTGSDHLPSMVELILLRDQTHQ